MRPMHKLGFDQQGTYSSFYTSRPDLSASTARGWIHNQWAFSHYRARHRNFNSTAPACRYWQC